MQPCPKCGGSMSPKQTPKGQVFECDQVNGECLNAKGYPNSVWPKTGGRSPAQQAAPQRAGMTKEGYWERKEERDIEASQRMNRSHAQEMAIRTVDILVVNGMCSTAEEMKAKLKELTDYYQRDSWRTASATTATQPEPEEVF